MKKALITGVTGQDGYYLSKFLLETNEYEVYGMYRRTVTPSFNNIKEFFNFPNFHLVEGDMTDEQSLSSLIKSINPDEVYNLAAQSFVGTSWNQPTSTAEINGIGVLRLLNQIKNNNSSIKFYQASTSELFGKVREIPQNEHTPFYPRSPYGVAKLFGYWSTVNYRESYNIYACNGILFNHESPIRGLEFVTRKITNGVAKIVNNQLDHIELGNLNARRDWGFAGDYVRAMWLMLQHEKPDDYVIASGDSHSVREFVELAFKYVNINIIWEDKEVNEVGKDSKTGKILVKVNPQYYRPSEVDMLLGDPTKARTVLNWNLEVSFEKLIEMMVNFDLEQVKK